MNWIVTLKKNLDINIKGGFYYMKKGLMKNILVYSAIFLMTFSIFAALLSAVLS